MHELVRATRIKPLGPSCSLSESSFRLRGKFAGEFVNHVSATDLKGRKGWRELLDLALKRRVDIILVWKLDRAFRSVHDASTTLRDLKQWGVGTAQGTHRLTTPLNVMRSADVRALFPRGCPQRTASVVSII